MPDLELLNESMVLRAQQLPSVLSRAAGPHAWGQILETANHSPCTHT